jgi:hypothetical protein
VESKMGVAKPPSSPRTAVRTASYRMATKPATIVTRIIMTNVGAVASKCQREWPA